MSNVDGRCTDKAEDGLLVTWNLPLAILYLIISGILYSPLLGEKSGLA